MSSDEQSNDPEWNLLPYDAAGFFQLSPEFDRNDLRRAYNRLIRIYKPERHPAEFQKIRAAFEQIDNELRYGQTYVREENSPTAAKDVWEQFLESQRESDFAARNDSTTSAGSSTPHAPQNIEPIDSADQPESEKPPTYIEQIIQRVRDKGPRAVFRELRDDTSDKSPIEYYVMALLSDAAGAPSLLRFVKCLLAGLQKHQDDRGLVSLLYSSLRQSVADDKIPSLLQSVARVVRTDRFYSLTEPLWDRLIQSRPADECIRLLSSCESQLQDYRIESRHAFYLHILRTMVWKADRDWIVEAFTFLNENSASMSYVADAELELLTAAHEYVEVRSRAIGSSTLRRQMDGALEAYFTEPPELRDYSFVECQIRMASSVDDVMRAFPFASESDCPELLTLWTWVSADVGERAGSPGQRDQEQLTDGRIRKHRSFLKRIHSQTNGSALGRIWQVTMILMAFGCDWAVTGITYMSLLTWLFVSMNAGLPNALGFSLVIAAVATWATVTFLVSPAWTRFCHFMGNRCYQHLWRENVAHYFARNRMSLRQFIELTQEVHSDNMYATPWMVAHAVEDEALPLYSDAQQYLS